MMFIKPISGTAEIKVLWIIGCLILDYMQKNVALALTLNTSISVVRKNHNSNEYTADYFEIPLKGNLTLHDINNIYDVMTDTNAAKLTDNHCPSMEDTGRLTQTQLINRITAPCRYDPLERPSVIEHGSVSNTPVNVFVCIYIYMFKALEGSDLHFKVHGVLQIRYNDSRLQFKNYEPNRTESIVGESLRSLIWAPHIFLANEDNFNVLSTNDRDIFTSISPSGTVILSSRMQSTLYCLIKLEKFPFEELFCQLALENWMYNSSQLLLHWEKHKPVLLDPKIHFTKYALQNVWTNETIINADLNELRHRSFEGNFSSLSFTVHLTREVGYYVIDYILPSIMIVAISWVTFWLQPDQTPARTTLGCTTLLSFITLTSSQYNTLSNERYTKISEVWFLGCTCFIFGSLVEFAFVNTIWRRKRSVDVKKVNSTCILKSTVTPNLKRHRIMNNGHCNNHFSPTKERERYLSVVDSPIIITVDQERTNKSKSTASIISQSRSVNKKESEKNDQYSSNNSWATMTPQEVSLWIDRKARFLFPLIFIIFNALFWTLVYCL